MVKTKDSAEAFYTLLKRADATYSKVPRDLSLKLRNITRALPEPGPRLLGYAGAGMEFLEARPFRPGDQFSELSRRLYEKFREPYAIKREAEIRQHIFCHRNPGKTMQVRYPGAEMTKKEAAETQMLALIKYLVVNEEMVGIMGAKGMHRESSAVSILGHHLLNVNIMTGEDIPFNSDMPENSTVILWDDFLVDHSVLAKKLNKFRGQNLNGHLLMVLDPAEINFGYKGATRFNGVRGELTQDFKKAEAARLVYHQNLRAHIEGIQSLCRTKGFKFVLQRLDEPLTNGLLGVLEIPFKTRGLELTA